MQYIVLLINIDINQNILDATNFMRGQVVKFVLIISNVGSYITHHVQYAMIPIVQLV